MTKEWEQWKKDNEFLWSAVSAFLFAIIILGPTAIIAIVLWSWIINA